MQRQKITKERVTLNPERERKDSEHCERVLNTEALKAKLEAAWYCVLGCGDALRQERCDFAHFRKALSPPLCRFVEHERHLSMLYRAFDTQHDGDEVIDFIGFVRSLFHLGMERFATDDYDVALNEMISQHLDQLVTNVRQLHNVNALTRDAPLLEDPDIDQILYVYDGVFERLFNRYRSADDHENRDLTLDQSLLLDQFVETLELREFAKDFGFFPRHLSWVEISMSAQMSCFGCIVRDPGLQGSGYQSSIETASPDKVKALRAAAVSKPIYEDDDAVIPTQLGAPIESAKNPLFVEVLPPEFLKDEPLLDKNRFMAHGADCHLG